MLRRYTAVWRADRRLHGGCSGMPWGAGLLVTCGSLSLLLALAGLMAALSLGCSEQQARSKIGPANSAQRARALRQASADPSRAVRQADRGRARPGAAAGENTSKQAKDHESESVVSAGGAVHLGGKHASDKLRPNDGRGEDSGRAAASSQLSSGVDANALARMLLVTPDGPLVVEMAITVDGRPFRTARRKLVDHVMRAGDVDGNGRTSWAELLDNTWRALGRSSDAVLMGMSRRDFLRSYDLNQNREVDSDEAERLVARLDDAGTAFSISGSTRFRGTNIYQSAVRALADRNGDSILSTAEIEALPVRLMSRDANDDGLVALAELASPGALFAEENVPAYPLAAFDCTAGGRFDSIYYHLLESFGVSGGLPQQAFEVCPAMHQALDEDGSGLVSQTEMERLAEIPPQFLLQCSFSEKGAVLEVKNGAVPLPGASIQSAPLQALVTLGGVCLRFLLRDAPARGDPKQQADELFDRVDADKNGYLTPDELRVRPAGLPELRVLDADGDQKIYPAELQGHLEMLVAPSLTGVHVVAADDRDAIFSLLDANGDGRLGAVEMAGAVACLRMLDADGDGAVDTTEFPAAMTISITRGRRSASAMATLQTIVGAPPAPPRGPSWFVHMDLNQDGAVTAREFLGTPEQFSQLDLDGDKAISVAEAGRLAEAQ